MSNTHVSSTKYPARKWSPTNFLLNVYWRLLAGVKLPRWTADLSLPSSAEVEN
jgi:hypothetical protein